MQINEYIKKMKKIHQNLLEYLDGEPKEEIYQNLLELLNDIQIHEHHSELKNYLHLIVDISNYYHRNTSFFSKIEQLILLYKDEIKQSFTNLQIYNIFRRNKRLLLFLSEQGLFSFDETIAKLIKEKEKDHFINYFYPELKEFFDIKKIEIESFEEQRKEGENNNSEINQIIRKDLIEEFIIYVNKNDLPLSTIISPSIFETHFYLLDKTVSLIEYAAFFGSIQIFKYLHLNNCKLHQNLWLFSVFGRNPEIFQILIDNKINPYLCNYEKLVIESIKSHHIEVTNYLTNIYQQFDLESNYNVYSEILKHRNYSFFPDDFNDNDTDKFFYLCKYDYYDIVDIILKKKDINVNKLIAIKYIQSFAFFYSIPKFFF